MEQKTKINCRNCLHFFITWDMKFPYGCKALNFKSKSIPSVDVKISSGIDCLKYEEKKNAK